MNRYLDIARQVVPDQQAARSPQSTASSDEPLSPTGRLLRLIFEVFPGTQIVPSSDTDQQPQSRDVKREGGDMT